MAPRHSRSRRSDSAALCGARAYAGVPIALFFVAALCCGILLWMSAAPAAAIPNDPQSVRLYGAVKTQVDDLRIQAGFVQADIDSLDTELEKRTEGYNQLVVQLDRINVHMADQRRQLAQAEADHAYRVRMFEERIRSLYKSGGRDHLLQLLLLSEGLDDLFNRVRLVATLADQDQRLVANLKGSTEELNTLLRDIDEQKREELKVRKQVSDQRAQIQATLAERQRNLSGIDTQISTIIEQERQRQVQEQEKLRLALLGLLNGGQVYSGPLPQTDSAILNQFVETAATYMGIPYVWAGDRPSTGFDCSGFTQYVYAQHGVDLPHYSGYQAQMGLPVNLESIQPGDLVAFGFPVHHVGIYIGDGLFIHAPRTGDVVKISPLSERTNLAAIRRFPLQPRNGAPAVR
jgi:cell wall-associated NlpC family hydrolase